MKLRPSSATAFDALALVALCGLAATWRLNCMPWGDVFGDAYMALECAYQVSMGRLWTAPSQPIYGHGLCLSYAPLFHHAESLLKVIERRALVGALVVPAYYLLALTAARRLWGAGLVNSRLIALTLGLLALRNDLLTLMGTSGTLGYFAPVLTLLIAIGLLRASTGRAPLGALLGFCLIPLALMNHPFTLWLAPAALLLLPPLRRNNGLFVAALGPLAALLLSGPRLLQLNDLIEGNGLVHGLGQIADPGSTPADLWAQLWSMIFVAGNLPIVLGMFALLFSPLLAHRGTANPDSTAVRFWAISGTVSLILTIATGVSLGYLRYYHLMFLHPFAVIGLAGLLGRLLERPTPATKATLSTVPALPAPLGIAVLAGCLTLAYGSVEEPFSPPCNSGAPLTKEAAGCDRVSAAIVAMQNQAPLTVDNLTGPSGGADSAVPIVLDLLLRGISEEQLYAPKQQEQMTWYWIIDRFEIVDPAGQQLDFNSLIEGLEQVSILLDLQRSGELVVMARGEAARTAFGEALCGALAPGLQLWGRTYKTWLGQLVRPGSEGIEYPEPYAPCLAARLTD